MGAAIYGRRANRGSAVFRRRSGLANSRRSLLYGYCFPYTYPSSSVKLLCGIVHIQSGFIILRILCRISRLPVGSSMEYIERRRHTRLFKSSDNTKCAWQVRRLWRVSSDMAQSESALESGYSPLAFIQPSCLEGQSINKSNPPMSLVY